MHQRRRYLKVLTVGTLCACGEQDQGSQGAAGGGGGDSGVGASVPSVGGSSSDGGSPGLKPFNAGSMDDFAVGELVGFSPDQIIVGRDASGFYAMTSVCTHSQCDTLVDGTIGPMQVRCGCHGSRYDFNGEVTQGPAVEGLQHYRVSFNAMGEVLVNTFAFVDKDERQIP